MLCQPQAIIDVLYGNTHFKKDNPGVPLAGPFSQAMRIGAYFSLLRPHNSLLNGAHGHFVRGQHAHWKPGRYIYEGAAGAA